MAYRQSRIERCWNAFALIVCLAAGFDMGYWHRNIWEALLFPLLMIVSGSLFSRLIGRFPHDGLTAPDDDSKDRKLDGNANRSPRS